MSAPARPETNEMDDELRPEYGPEDFARGVRGKYFERYQTGTNLALLAPDVRAAFPTDESVNDALRLLLKLAQQTTGQAAGQALPQPGLRPRRPVGSRRRQEAGGEREQAGQHRR